MPARRARLTAGVLLAVVVVLELATVALSVGQRPLAEPVIYLGYATVQAAAGALIIQRYPSHRIGWLLLLYALLNAVVADLGLAYGGRAAGSGWPLGPLAEVLSMVSWIFAASGLVLLFLCFPDGHLPDRRWRWVVWAWAAGAALAVPGWATSPRLGADLAAGVNPYAVDGLPSDLLFGIGAVLVCGSLLASVVALVLRRRRSDGTERDQLTWVVLAATVAGVVLTMSAALWTVWRPVGLLAAVALLLIPVAVAVAILRHGLYDVDLVVARTAAYAVIVLVLGAAYVSLVVVVARFVVMPVAAGIAALVITLTARPVHDRAQAWADRAFRPARHRATTSVRAYVDAVRRGDASAGEVGDALRDATRDPGLLVHLRLADGDLVDPAGAPVDVAAPLASGRTTTSTTRADTTVVITHRAGDSRLVAAVIDAGRLALEMAVLQVQLQRRLRELDDSRRRIQSAADDERRRLSRDLHDGAQQRLVAIGLTLRHAQHRLGTTSPDLDASLDDAVGQLTAAIDELRDLAGGLRPASLDHGLADALHELAARTPARIAITAGPERFALHLEAAAYFIACEAVTNAVKHAEPSRVDVTITSDGPALVVRVEDDGRGGVDLRRGTGLLGVSDRVRAHHGELTIDSRAGHGTRLEARLPCV